MKYFHLIIKETMPYGFMYNEYALDLTNINSVISPLEEYFGFDRSQAISEYNKGNIKLYSTSDVVDRYLEEIKVPYSNNYYEKQKELLFTEYVYLLSDESKCLKRIMSLISVKHVSHCGTIKNSGNEIEKWEKETGRKRPFICPDCGERVRGNNIIVGAHVVRQDRDYKRVFLTPTCKSCNSSGTNDHHDFYTTEMLVPLDGGDIE